MNRTCVIVGLLMVLFSAHQAQALVFSAAGVNPAGIQTTVDAFRSAAGGANNGALPGSQGSGRREVNWDGVPDGFASPNALPGNFFNTNSTRGIVLSTPGTGLQVSGNPGIAPVEFDNIVPNYSDVFATFSAARLFTPIGSNIVDVTFFIPGTDTPAVTSGFGSVFSDVDLSDTTSIQYFDVANNSLGTFFVQRITGNETLSFLGVTFASAEIARVRITAGNQLLSPGNLSPDLVVMDDFIYYEPVPATTAVPEPATAGFLSLLAISGCVLLRRHQRG